MMDFFELEKHKKPQKSDQKQTIGWVEKVAFFLRIQILLLLLLLMLLLLPLNTIQIYRTTYRPNVKVAFRRKGPRKRKLLASGKSKSNRMSTTQQRQANE